MRGGNEELRVIRAVSEVQTKLGVCTLEGCLLYTVEVCQSVSRLGKNGGNPHCGKEVCVWDRGMIRFGGDSRLGKL